MVYMKNHLWSYSWFLLIQKSSWFSHGKSDVVCDLPKRKVTGPPFFSQVFVAANSNAVLRLVNLQNGMALQKLKVGFMVWLKMVISWWFYGDSMVIL